MISKTAYDYLESAKKQFFEKELSLELLNNKLTVYQENIFKTDSSIREEFEKSFDFRKIISKVASSSTLTILQNSIKIVENKLIAFCNAKVGSTIDFFDTYSVIVGQSSNYLKPESELEITAGVGAFSKSSQRQIRLMELKLNWERKVPQLTKSKLLKSP